MREGMEDAAALPGTAPHDVLAMDVGGTSIKCAVVTKDGRVSNSRSYDTPRLAGPDAVVDRIVAIAASTVAQFGTIGCVGVAIPGAVDSEAGVACHAANFGWTDVPLRAIIQRQLGLPVVVEHDVRAAALAEREVGAAQGFSESLVVVIGTGIAAVLTAGGRQVAGVGGRAGELGHIPVWPDGELCPCGQTGCLERYASAAAMERHYYERTGERMSAGRIAIERASDKPWAVQCRTVWDEAVAALAIGLATCAMLLDPEAIVIGGGLSYAGEEFRRPVADALARRISRDKPPIVKLARYRGNSAVLGVALRARSLKQSVPALSDGTT